MTDRAPDLSRRNLVKHAAALAGVVAAVDLDAAEISVGAAPLVADEGTRVLTSDKAVVETTAGKVRGFSRNGVHIFRGIPYGDTTAGENRFQPAQRPKPWSGVRSSTSWGPVCPAGPRAGWRNDEEQFLYQWDDGFPGEDMLRINVWTPAVNDGRRRPVLAWIHGGGFVSGSSQELRPYDGERLARVHDVVLVSMNHRLNVFGFLDLSQIGGDKYASSANVGMLDLVQSLQWVRDNIANFGGDPGNVTIFGQSGGGRKVSTLLGMPTAKGLFHRAAVFSGSHLRQILPEASTRLASGVLDVLGISKTDLARIHQIPTDQLLNAGLEAQRRTTQGATPTSPALAWGPVVDGRLIPAHTFDPTPSPLAVDVPMLIGNTYAEFGGGANNPDAHQMTIAQVRERLTPTLGAKAGEIIEAYQRTFPNAKPFEINAVIVGTQAYRINAVMQAERKAAQKGAPVYMYWFGWKTPVLDGRPLAYHCQDLAFWFDNIDLAAQATGGGDDARALASKMSGALVAFAKGGDPNHAGLPKWPAFNEPTRATMVFENDHVTVKNDPDGAARRLLQSAQRA